MKLFMSQLVIDIGELPPAAIEALIIKGICEKLEQAGLRPAKVYAKYAGHYQPDPRNPKCHRVTKSTGNSLQNSGALPPKETSASLDDSSVQKPENPQKSA